MISPLTFKALSALLITSFSVSLLINAAALGLTTNSPLTGYKGQRSLSKAHIPDERRSLDVGMATCQHRRRCRSHDFVVSACGTDGNMDCDQVKSLKLLAEFQQALNQMNKNVSRHFR